MKIAAFTPPPDGNLKTAICRFANWVRPFKVYDNKVKSKIYGSIRDSTANRQFGVYGF